MDRRIFLKRTGQTIAGAAVAPMAVAAASPAKIPLAQESDVYFGTRSILNAIDMLRRNGVKPDKHGYYRMQTQTGFYMVSAGATPAEPLNIKVIQPEDFYK